MRLPTRKLLHIFIQMGVLFLIFFTPIPFGSIDLWAVTIMRIAVGLITLAWLLQIYLERVGSRSTLTPLSRTPLDLPILLSFGWIVLNTYLSVYPYASLGWLYQFLSYALLYQVLVHSLRTRRQLIGLVSILVIAGSLEALFGLVRYLQGSVQLFGREVMRGMVTGTFISRTHVAVYLEMSIPLAIGLIFLARELEKKLLLATLIAIMGTALALSLSRGGILSFLLSLVFLGGCMAIHRTDRRGVWILFTLFLVIFIYLFWVGVTPVIERLEGTWAGGRLDESSLVRLAFWQNSLELLKEAPLLGTGLGTFPYVFLKYMPYLGPTLRAFHAESIYIEFLVDVGLLGLALFLWGVIRVFRYALRRYFLPGESSLKLLALAALTGCLAFLLHGFVDFNLRVPSNALLFTLILTILTASLRLMKDHGSQALIQGPWIRDHRLSPIVYRPSPLALGFGALLVLAFLSLALKSYLAEAYFQQAQNYRKDHRWEQALAAYEKAIRLEGGNAVYYSELGNAYLELANDPEARSQPPGLSPSRSLALGSAIDKALEAHARSVALNPFEPGYHLNLGKVYALLGNSVEAAAEFEKAVSSHPNNPYYHRYLGQYSLSHGNLDRGISAYQRALMLDISNLSAIFEECLLYGKDYTLCTQIIPDTLEARRQFARFLISKNLWSEGEAEYERGLQLAGENPSYYQEFAKFYTQRGKYLKAISLWRRLLIKDPENLAVRFQIAQAYQALKNWKSALEEYQRIVEMKPEDVRAWQGIGDVSIQMKQPERALEAYKKALAWLPQQSELYGLMGEVYVQMGNFHQAIETYQTAIGLKRNERRYYERLAEIYHRMGKTFEALTAWDRYLEVNANDAVARYKLAEYQKQMGNWLEAVKEAKIAVTLDPRNISYRSFLADLYLSRGMAYEAVQQWEAIVQVNPKNPGSRLQLAALYEKLSQFDKARSEYQATLDLQPGNSIARQKLNRPVPKSK